MLIENTLDLGDFCDGFPLAKVNNLPTAFLDTDGMVIDRFAPIPLYGVVNVPALSELELTAGLMDAPTPEKKQNDFADFDTGMLDPLGGGIDAARSDTSSVKVNGVGLHSRAYAPVTAFHYVGSDTVFLSLSGDDGGYFDDILSVCSEGGESAKVENGLILLSGVKQGVVITLRVVRLGMHHRVTLIFN